MVYFKVWLLFIRTIFSFLLFPESNSKYHLSGKKLLSLTFRYSEKNKNSFRFYIRSFISVLFGSRIYMKNACHIYTSGTTFFYDNDFSIKNEKARVSHIEYFLKRKISGSVWKDRLNGYFTVVDKLLQVIFEIGLFVTLSPIVLFSKHKGSVGLIFSEYIELVNLLKVVKENEIKTLYYYSIYEKDSNISSIALQSENIKVIKITSLTPLRFWNNIIVAANGLILCDMNQFDELNDFKETIQVKNIMVWGPETIADSAGYYMEGSKYDTNKGVIGFYSTASYLRTLQGDIEQNNMKRNEDLVKSYLAEYLKEHKNIKLVIFPHPREKKENVKNNVIDHYKVFFNDIQYVIYEGTSSSSRHFDMVDLGVAMYSSVIYERLYFGFKSVMMPFGEEGMKLPGDAINAICANSKIDLFYKIEMFLNASVLEYFNYTGLKKSVFMIEALKLSKNE